MMRNREKEWVKNLKEQEGLAKKEGKKGNI